MVEGGRGISPLPPSAVFYRPLPTSILVPMTATAADTRDILDELKKRRVRFLLLQFTDLLGVNKAVEVPASQFEKALAGEVTFDGSALEGFARVEEADALLVPDLASFRVFPWDSGGSDGADGEADGAVARLICDIGYPDGRSFEGCPRTTGRQDNRYRRSVARRLRPPRRPRPRPCRCPRGI